MAVTGRAGFLGKPTTALLHELGVEVSAVRSAEKDLRQRDAAFEALEGAQVVLLADAVITHELEDWSAHLDQDGARTTHLQSEGAKSPSLRSSPPARV
jgi:uncharacterized protein YbjT (DUF2867 family)